MQMLGLTCRRRLLTEYIRLDLLPYPEQGLWYKRVDVERVVTHFAERRRRRAQMERDGRRA